MLERAALVVPRWRVEMAPAPGSRAHDRRVMGFTFLENVTGFLTTSWVRSKTAVSIQVVVGSC